VRLARAILLRLAVGVASLIFISFVTFVADMAAPGDPALVRAGDKASLQTIARIRHEMGLDRPWPVRYVDFIEKAVHLDFGTSYYGTQEPVGNIIKRDIPMTARTASCAILLATIVGILLGTAAAVRQNRFTDRTILAISTLGVTVPTFVLAPILVYIYCLQLNQLPQTWQPLADQRASTAPDWVYLLLPVVVLAARPTALLTRLTRASMIDTLQQEFIRTAVAKGVPPMRLIFRHALRNAILPVITAIGTSFGFLLTGSFVVERFFTLPGIGSETIDAMGRGDTPVIQACVILTGAMFIVVNLLVDVILPLLDPRIREAQI
jgi:ABC-type dipeptide/oligopeptide/nickel transport system permease component